MKRLYRFPGSCSQVHQNGEQLTPDSAGINIAMEYQDDPPTGAEVYSDNCDEYADIGLEWEYDPATGYTMTGYDGAFNIPPALLRALQLEGFTIAADLLEDFDGKGNPVQLPEPCRIPSDEFNVACATDHVRRLQAAHPDKEFAIDANGSAIAVRVAGQWSILAECLITGARPIYALAEPVRVLVNGEPTPRHWMKIDQIGA